MSDNFKYIQGLNYSLAGSGCSAAATSIILVAFNDVNANVLAMSDFGTIGFIVLEPKTSKVEIISFTGVTVNGDGTSTLTGVTRGLKAKAPYDAGGYGQSHSGGSIAIISNPPQFYDQLSGKNDDETINGIWTFTQSPVVPTGGTGTQAANATDIANAITGATGTATNLVAGTVKTSVAPGGTGIAIITIDPLITAPQSGNALNSSTNKIEDVADTSATGSPNRLVRANGSGKIDSTFLDLTSVVKFGGTGADGALSISSGTTTLAMGAAVNFVKNYTSISITGTGQLAFSGPATNGTFVALRSQGAVVLTSSTSPNIDGSGMGGAGGAGATGTSAGSNGTVGANLFLAELAGIGATNQNGAAATASVGSQLYQTTGFYSRFIRLFTGSGGGGGSAQTAASGAGGAGGGSLLIECAGALNLTATVAASTAGKVGVAGSGPSSGSGGGGGGGGAGGSLVILYNSLTANSGGVSATGGAGGVGGSQTTGTPGAAGAAGNGTAGSGIGGAGGVATGGSTGGGGAGGGSDSGMSNGGTGGNSTNSVGIGGGGGGGGSSGYSLVAQNVWFA